VNPIRELFASDLKVVNVGLKEFSETLLRRGITSVHLDWRPPAGGDPEVISLLKSVIPIRERIAKANAVAVARVIDADPVWDSVAPARDVIPFLRNRALLHAGPPVEWGRMCGPLKGAIVGAALFEGWAESAESAERLATSGEIRFAPCHDHDAVGPMAGVVAPSMPVVVVRNREAGNVAYASLNEGVGKALRFGANGPEVIRKLAWMRDVFGPFLKKVLAVMGSIEIKPLIAQAVQMGDECHNRNKAATALLIRSMAHAFVTVAADTSFLDADQVTECIDFLVGNEHFFLNISMAAAKTAMDAAADVPASTMISAMTRNGTEFGIRVSGLGPRWFTGPAGMVDGLFFPGFGPDDANPDMGDSTITETAGLGGFAMAGAIPIVQFVGGTASDALSFSRSMYRITLSENGNHRLPTLDFRGTPTGIDMLKVLECDLLPVLNTGIAHRKPGIGQIGAGIARPPVECFKKAFQAFAEKYRADKEAGK
jgi:hypothetical protein